MAGTKHRPPAPPRWLASLGIARAMGGSTLGLVLGCLVGWGCDPIGLPLVSFRCQPNADTWIRCPESYRCCSDEGAFLGSPEMRLFAGTNNDLSESGMCVHEGLEDSAAVVDGCPVPCNPTWSAELVAEACGSPEVVCCQTVELHEDDCVFDGAEGRWRPADGRDAEASLDGGRGWVPTANSTHQDPDFVGCELIAGDRSSPRFRECVRQLGTANQRGYCMGLQAGQCPTDAADYVDACEAMN